MNPFRRAMRVKARAEDAARERQRERAEPARPARRGTSPFKVLPISLRTAAEFLEASDDFARADLTLPRHLAASGLDDFKCREVTRAVMAWFRWRGWLDAAQNKGGQIVGAIELHNRLLRHPAGIGSLERAVPAWLRQEVELPPATLAKFQREPVLWLRGPAHVAAELRDCRPADPSLAPRGQKLQAWQYLGRDDIFRTPAFERGEIEVQDLASQLVGHLCAPQPGETWWDACAGEGGKAIHLAQLMQGRGLVWATDRGPRKLAALKKRAARAGVFNLRLEPWDGTGLPAKNFHCDGVLVDAPCSGVGTWQRHPHARWTTTHDDVRELATLQRQLLAAAAAAVKPGGRLVYSVCTLTRSETEAVADAFAKAHPDFAPEFRRTLWPHELNANGMFVAAWRRKTDPGRRAETRIVQSVKAAPANSPKRANPEPPPRRKGTTAGEKPRRQGQISNPRRPAASQS